MSLIRSRRTRSWATCGIGSPCSCRSSSRSSCCRPWSSGSRATRPGVPRRRKRPSWPGRPPRPDHRPGADPRRATDLLPATRAGRHSSFRSPLPGKPAVLHTGNQNAPICGGKPARIPIRARIRHDCPKLIWPSFSYAPFRQFRAADAYLSQEPMQYRSAAQRAVITRPGTSLTA